MEVKSIKIEDTKLGMGLSEVMNLLSSVSLASVTIGDFLVVMRSDFDLTISGEPYTGLVLLLNLVTGRFMSRIWNQTVATGTLVKASDLMEACENLFGQGRPCLGCPQGGNFKHRKKEFLISQTPIPRKIARSCLKVLGKDTHASISSCSECMRLSYASMGGVNDVDKENEAKGSLSKRDTGEHVSLTAFKTEYMGEYVSDDLEDVVTKTDVHNVNVFQGGDSDGIVPHFLTPKDWKLAKAGESGRKTVDQEDKHPSTHHNKGQVDPVETRKQNDKERNANKKFSCKRCPNTYTTLGSLVRHIKGQHDNIKEHACQLCGYASSRRHDLKYHMDTKHKMGEKRFKCEKCPYACYDRSSLNKHIEVVHDQVRKHVCEECGSAFGQRAQLTEHIKRIHNNILPEKNFICDECGHAATRRTHLESHKKMHSKEEKKFKCAKCPYASHFNHMLKKHIRIIHDKIRKYVCEDCGYAASSNGNLKKHLKAIHQQIRNHVCGQCGYAASEISNLKSHIERVHKR